MTLEFETGTMGALAGALAKAQAAFPSIPRDRTVTVKMTTGGSYQFSYAPLDTILSAVRPALSANGLAISQLLDGTDLLTMLLHESGAALQGRVAVPNNGNVQQLGSAITYLRRYALQAILGIASEEDDDGNASAGNRATPTARRTDVDRSTGEIRPRPTVAGRPVLPSHEWTGAVPIGDNDLTKPAPALSDADVADLHARFAEPENGAHPAPPFTDDDLSGIAPTGGMSTVELFSRAEESGITKPQLTVAAKTLFGVNRWKVTELTDQDRLALWEEVHP